MLNKKRQKAPRPKNSYKHKEDGFSLIETIIAIFILTIGLLGAVASLTYAMQYTNTSRNVGQAKSIIVSSLEEIESLRNTRRLEFKQIATVGQVDNTDASNTFGGFSNDFKEISLIAGPDGIFGTDDDLIEAGPDNIYGTGDDFTNPAMVRTGYSRKITITPFPSDPTIKKVEVRVKYVSASGSMGEITGVSYINDESRTTG